jgi:hypothetical protein
MNRLIINFGFAVGLVLLINCGQEESSGGDSIYWGTYVVFEDDVEGLFQSNDSYDVTKFNASTPREHNVFNSTFEHELANGRNRFLWSLSGLTPHYLDYGNGDIDTLTHISKEFDPKADYPSDIRYYLNGEEVAHFDLRIGGIINELSARNNFSSSRWTNDPILIVLPKKPEM